MKKIYNYILKKSEIFSFTLNRNNSWYKTKIIYTGFIIIHMCLCSVLYGQKGISINTTGNPPDNSAILDVSCNGTPSWQGMLIPRMTTAERNSILTPAASLVIFNTTTNCFEFYMGTWQTIACSSCTNPPAAPSSIIGSATVCANTSGNIYSVAAVSGATYYTWGVPSGATIPAGQGNTSASINFGSISGNVSVTANNACGASSTIIFPVTVAPDPGTPGAISGSVNVCSGSSGNVYSINAVGGATSYTWSVPAGAAIIAGQGTTSIVITFGSASGNINVVANNSCGEGNPNSLTVTVNLISPTPGAITGITTLCSGQSGVAYSIPAVAGATSYTWSVPSGASITAGQTTNNITVTFGVSSGNVNVTANNSCGSSAASTLAATITSSTPSTPGTITGLISPCSGQAGVVYTIAPVANATSYKWTVPTGGSITTGQGTTSATITFGNNSGSVSVAASNGCGTSGAQTLAVTIITVAPATPGPITGPAVVCGSQTGVVYSIAAVSGATNYTWNVPAGATITAGQGTPSITVSYGSTGGNLTVTANNACGISAANILAITISSSVPAAPGSISGPTTFCSGSTGNIYTIDAVSGATSYTWSVPSGSTVVSGQGTNTVTVTFGSTSGNITVKSVNGCGSSSTSILAVTMATPPATPGAITGTVGPCSGQMSVVYYIAPVSGATYYSWTVPPGSSILSGQLTTSITVTFGSTSGTIAVTADNTCGNSSAQQTVITILSTPPATPGVITGFPSVATGQAGVVYSIVSVSGAATYTWTVSGGIITSGQGTTSIIVTWGSNPGVFNPGVSVTATNGCGTSAESDLTITIFATPTNNYQTFSYTGAVQSFTVPSGVTSILVIAEGAAGGSAMNFINGAPGGTVVGNLTVTPGQILNIIVGGVGGTQSGFSANEFEGGSGGGGFSGVLDNIYNHMISAGGAGGFGSSIGGLGGSGNASGTNGGAGGINGSNPAGGSGGNVCPGGNNGFLGTAVAGGNGGAYVNGTFAGGGGGGGYGFGKGIGGSGSFGSGSGGFGGGGGGGGGAINGSSCATVAGGGGGGGYTGGNGGNISSSGPLAGGGGGGSNYANLTIVTSVLQNLTGGANNTGITGLNGEVVIGW